MKNGRLIAQGTHDDLLATSAAYRQIFVPQEDKKTEDRRQKTANRARG
jgi:ABC-type transport system involved in cytochrome bd biosynthesis fused ATPase/permease subunit